MGTVPGSHIAKTKHARLGKVSGGGAFFAFLYTERLFTTISEPGTGYLSMSFKQ